MVVGAYGQSGEYARDRANHHQLAYAVPNTLPQATYLPVVVPPS